MSPPSQRNKTMELPPEIWELIFHHVQWQNCWTSADDLINCSKTCVAFRNILEADKCTWLFKNVLPCILDLLDKSTALTLRRVCTAWKLAVDHHLENYQYYQTTKQVNRSQSFPYRRSIREEFHPLGCLQWFTSFSTVENMELFLKSHSTHSFPGRSLSLSYTSPVWNISSTNLNPIVLHNADRHREHFFGFISELLYGFGSKLYYLNIRIRSHVQADFLIGLVSGLNLTPNLKRLHLDIQFGSDDNHITMPTLPNDISIADFLPPLRHLECLEFTHDYISCLENHLSDSLQLSFSSRYLSQLTKFQLMLDEYNWEPDCLKRRGVLEAANLKELELKLTYGDHVNIFYLLAKARAKLRMVTLHFTYNVRRVPDLEWVVKSIYPFSNTLEVLHVFSWSRYINGCSMSSFAAITYSDAVVPFQPLHSLRVLQLHGFDCENWEILGSLPTSLKRLYLDCPYKKCFPCDLKYCDISHAHGAMGVVWAKLPKLELIRLGHMTDYILIDGYGQPREVKFEPVVYSRRRWEWEQMHGLVEEEPCGKTESDGSTKNGMLCCLIL